MVLVKWGAQAPRKGRKKMKKYRYNLCPNCTGCSNCADCTVYVADSRIISKLYHGFEKTGVAESEFCSDPILPAGRMYGLSVDSVEGTMVVMAGDTVLRAIVDGDLVEAE
jgi:hypothetical protein